MERLSLAIIFVIFFCECNPRQAASEGGSGEPVGMLILGSGDKNSLVERVKLGYELYSSPLSFDYIIVSGGCAAHGSSFCEASEMARLLAEMGVPASKVFKEEKSKSTVQNYCFSRELKGNDGAPIISEGDSLYVVSNHWHAIPVAARFRTYDGVNAVYYISGDILPEKTDKTDYTNIYDNGLNSEEFCN